MSRYTPITFAVTFNDESVLATLDDDTRIQAQDIVYSLHWLPYSSLTFSRDESGKVILTEVSYRDLSVLDRQDSLLVVYHRLRNSLIADGQRGKYALVNTNSSLFLFDDRAEAIRCMNNRDALVVHIGREHNTWISV